jgi:hypothetical protein
MKIEFEGHTWSYDDEDITVAQAEVIEQQTGGSVADWAQSRAGLGAKPYRILYWLMCAQNGDPVQLAEVNFRLLPFVEAFTTALRAEVAQEAPLEADPTVLPPTQDGGSPPHAARHEATPPGPLPG